MTRSTSSCSRTIAHLLPWPGVGGTEHATLRIAKAIATRGFRSVFFCLPQATNVHALFRDAGFPTFEYNGEGVSLRRPAGYLRSTRALAQALTSAGADLLHCADVMGAVYGAPAGRLAGIPVVCHVRNQYEGLTLRDRLPLQAVSSFAFVSKDTWRGFDFPVGPTRGRVLYDGIDLAPPRQGAESRHVRAELGLPLDAPVVGMVARVSPQKDYFTLARAAARVLRVLPDTRFVVVGDISHAAAHREHFESVRAELLRLGIFDSFVFTGFRSDVSRVMQAFDVFVLSTHFEGLPLVVLEAMGAGIPTVATAVNGIPEVIRDPNIGLLFPHEDDAQLAEHLVPLLSSRAEMQRLGDAGRQFVSEQFSVASFIDNLVGLYDEMLSV